jgi:effector-binding domain-containing protein
LEEKERVMVSTSDIQVRHLPGGNVAYQTFRGTIPSIEAVISSVRSWAVTMGFKPAGPVAVEVTGVPTDDLTQEYDMEVQLPLGPEAKSHPSDRVQIKPFAETDAVVMTLHGPHELTRLAEPLGELQEWMQGQNLQPGPVVRWVEITDPAKSGQDEHITEVQYLVSR